MPRQARLYAPGLIVRGGTDAHQYGARSSSYFGMATPVQSKAYPVTLVSP